MRGRKEGGGDRDRERGRGIGTLCNTTHNGLLCVAVHLERERGWGRARQVS